MPRFHAADPAPLVKFPQAGVPPDHAGNERAGVPAIWTAEPKGDGGRLEERPSGPAGPITTRIQGVHEGLAEARDKGKPMPRRISAARQAVLDGIQQVQSA